MVFNRSDSALNFSNVISGTGSVTQSGTGTVALTGVNTYTGTTGITSGNLQVGLASAGQTGTGATTVNGSTAVLSGTGTVQGTATVTLGSIRPGDSGGTSTGTLNFSGGLTFNPTSATTVSNLTLGPTSGVNDKINVTGALTLNGNSNFIVTFDPGYTLHSGDSWNLLDWTGALSLNGFNTGANFRSGGESALIEGNLDLPDLTSLAGYGGQSWQISDLGTNALTITVTGVPEPSRVLLLLVGSLGVVLRRHKNGLGKDVCPREKLRIRGVRFAGVDKMGWHLS